jgi:branched-subunit amino acid transport protein
VSEAWLVTAALAAMNLTLKAVGPVVGRRRLPPLVQRLIEACAPALLAALVVTGTFAAGRELALDARAGGLAAATLALALRAPVLVVVLAAAGGTALLRAV